MSGGETALLVSALLAGLALAIALQRSRRRARAAAAAFAHTTAALRERTAELTRLSAAFDGAVGGLIVLDEQQRIVATNLAAQELAGLSGTARGRVLPDVVPWPLLREHLDRLRDGDGGEAEFELETTGPDGARSLVVRLRALAGLGFAVGFDDQSRIKRLESLRRDFVANVSHELKTPLAAIQGFVETLLDDPDMPLATRQRFLERLARQSERLSTLVGDLLTLSRLDEPSGLDDAEPCDFGAVVRETLRDLGPLAEKKGLRLQTQIPEEAIWLRADREALRQVASNLVDNAIKYTQLGGRVAVTLAVEGKVARLQVWDTGIGLSPEDQQRVFERFYRVDRARSRELGGTGLGLSIVKNTVRGLGGDVGVRSAIGQGSTFWVELPIHELPKPVPDDPAS